jgi:DNA-binding MarR family transcriptional regulator
MAYAEQTQNLARSQHHSAVELVNRTEHLGLIIRNRDSADHRTVRLKLADNGAQVLESLTSAHLEELERLTTLFETLTDALRQ